MYDAASAYALAFSYRDIPVEVDALLGWATLVVGQPITSVLELAAGPADHARECAARGLRATALDLSPAMTEYAAAHAGLSGVPLEVVTADMCEFAIEQRFDLAFTMIDSLTHVLDDERLDAHFRCVATHLIPSGCYIIELSHPADSLQDQVITLSEWTQTRGDEAVSMRWGEPLDATDATTGITSVTVTLEHRRDGRPPVVTRDVVLEHGWSREAITASLARVGSLEALGWYGSFDGIGLDDEKAWRMIVVLQRR